MRSTSRSHGHSIKEGLDLDVGVVFTHETDLMPRLLSTLCRSGDSLAMRLILVDNASDHPIDQWDGYFSRTKFVRNKQRLGYAANLNRILQHSSAPHVLLLNTDMYFDPQEQCLSKMVQFMQQQRDCGIAGCRLYHPDGTYAYPARRFQSVKTVVARRLSLQYFLKSEIDRYLYVDRGPEEQFDCDWLSGCFLMVRRDALQAVGELDSGFVKYFEDVDFCLRMARAGWRVMFNGATYGYHLEQRDSQRVVSHDAWKHLRSYLRWLAKWGFRPQRPVVDSKVRSSRRAA